jgi:hypothetical protein
MVTLAVLTLGFGVAALIAETVWALLVPMVAGLVLMAWPAGTVAMFRAGFGAGLATGSVTLGVFWRCWLALWSG